MSSFRSFEAGRQAWQDGHFFDAHEHWEEVWRASTDGAERDGLQGLVQLAASLHKGVRGEATGQGKLWAKGRTRLAEAARRLPALFGVDLPAFLNSLPVNAPDPAKRPELSPRAASFGVVYLHGFGSSPDSPKGQAVARALEGTGVPLAAPHLAEPEEFFDFTVSRSLGRAGHALFPRTLLVGSSLGGWTGTLLARDDERILELFLLCPAFHFPERWFGPEQSDELARWRADGQLHFEVGHPPAPRPLGVGFLEDGRRHDGGVQPRCPTTIVHGRHDEVVPLPDVERVLAERTDPPKVDLQIVDDDHGLRKSLTQITEQIRARVVALRGAAAERE